MLRHEIKPSFISMTRCDIMKPDPATQTQHMYGMNESNNADSC